MLLEGYYSRNVHNKDEAVLFLKLLSSKILAVRVERCQTSGSPYLSVAVLVKLHNHDVFSLY